MPEDFTTIDPELLLQELRARESRAVDPKRLEELFPTGRVPSARQGIGGVLDTVPTLAGIDTATLVDALLKRQKVIYGVDDRLDMYQVADLAIQRDADAVVALIDMSSITDNGDGTSTITGTTYADAQDLCGNEPFRAQPAIAFCSGFLVDPSIIASAAHCVNDQDLASTRFVFGFEMRDAQTAVTTIDNGEIYRGIRILGRQIGTEGTDWALVQLDRAVPNHTPVRIRRADTIADGEAVHVIGHPSGLPKKYAGGAIVRDNSNLRYFIANLDTYGGNSGSPVFNSNTHEVEGILVRGDTDFVLNGGCYVSLVCPANGCRGEDCTRTTEFAALVPDGVEDCIPFDPTHAQVVQASGRWKVEADGMWLLDFGASEAEARQALQVIQHYGMNSQCFVGRPDPSMEYYLVDGHAPAGALAGEDAIPFDPQALEVQRIRNSWKIVEGNHWLMDFDQNEAEARQALSTILRYGFRFICFVGRPDPSMTYFRT